MSNGLTTAPNRPTPIAQPMPVARIESGYSCGAIEYNPVLAAPIKNPHAANIIYNRLRELLPIIEKPIIKRLAVKMIAATVFEGDNFKKAKATPRAPKIDANAYRVSALTPCARSNPASMNNIGVQDNI